MVARTKTSLLTHYLPDRVTSSRHLCLKYGNEMLPLCRVVMRIRNNNWEILNILKAWSLFCPWLFPSHPESPWHVAAHHKHSSNNRVSGLPADHLHCDYPNCFLNVRTHPQTGWVRISRGKPGTLRFHKFPSGSAGPQSLRINFLELEK